MRNSMCYWFWIQVWNKFEQKTCNKYLKKPKQCYARFEESLSHAENRKEETARKEIVAFVYEMVGFWGRVFSVHDTKFDWMNKIKIAFKIICFLLCYKNTNKAICTFCIHLNCTYPLTDYKKCSVYVFLCGFIVFVLFVELIESTSIEYIYNAIRILAFCFNLILFFAVVFLWIQTVPERAGHSSSICLESAFVSWSVRPINNVPIYKIFQ